MKIGIVSWGAQIPTSAVETSVIAKSQGKLDNPGESLGIIQKTCPQKDEDTVTLSTQAALNAINLLPSQAAKSEIGSLLIGSESHPYAVKPTGTVVAQALGLSHDLSMADLQFACKAGTQALALSFAQVGASQIKLGLAIGSDTAQSKPGDILEYAAGSGAAAFITGSSSTLPLAATLEATYSFATDTPDFWRRTHALYPEHAGRFSGEPAYFYHIKNVASHLLSSANLTSAQIDYCIFHTPNAKFPLQISKELGFTADQLKHSLVVSHIGNTYAASVPLALTNVLDHAVPNQTILVVSYGSGAGSDGFIFRTTSHLTKIQSSNRSTLSSQIDHLTHLDLVEYLSLSRSRTH